MRLGAIITIYLILACSLAYADASEYLFSNETLGAKQATIEINGANIDIYSISGSNDLLPITREGKLATGEDQQLALFSYETHTYVEMNEEEIKRFYHRTYNLLDDMTESDEQRFLDLFQALNGVCVKVPDFQLIQVCVEPSKDLDIMKIGWLGRKIPDWDVAYDNYKSLGSRVLVFTDTTSAIKYKTTNDFYRDMTITHSFLTVATQIKGVQFIDSNVLTPTTVASSVGKKTKMDTQNIDQRMLTLKRSEKQRYEDIQNKLNEVKETLQKISIVRGNYSSLNNERKAMATRLDAISTSDDRFKSDISQLDSIYQEAIQLKQRADDEYGSANAAFNSRSWWKKIAKIVGWLDSLSI